MNYKYCLFQPDVMVLNDIIEQAAGRHSRASDHGGKFCFSVTQTTTAVHSIFLSPSLKSWKEYNLFIKIGGCHSSENIHITHIFYCICLMYIHINK